MQAYGQYTVVLAVFMLFFACGRGDSAKPEPQGIAGVLDLRGRDFEKDGPIQLVGQWEFYWNQLLKPEDFTGVTPPAKTGFFKVPGVWNEYDGPGGKLPPMGFATYRLRIQLDPGQESLALRIPDMNTAYTLYVNGKLLSSNGRVARTRENTIPQDLPRTVYFQKSSGALDVILQVSNFHFRRGGPWLPVTLGSKAGMTQKREIAIIFALFITGSLTIMGLYHYGIFFMRRKDRAPLYFGFFCFLVAIYGLVTGERILISLFPNVPWELYVKLEYITFYMGLPAFVSFLNAVFPRAFSKRVQGLMWVTTLLFCLLVTLTPARIYSYSLQFYQMVVVIALIYMLYVLLAALIRKLEGALVFLLGLIVLGAGVINDILFQYHFTNVGDMGPVGLFFFIFVQAYLMSTRSSRAFAAVEELTNEMEAKVKERTREAEDGRRYLEELSNLSRRVSEAGELSSVVTAVHQALLEHLGPLGLGLLLLDKRQGELYMDSYRPPPGAVLTPEQERFIRNIRVPLKPESGTLYRTYTRKRSLLLSRVTKLQNSSVDMKIVNAFGLGFGTFGHLPLLVQNDLIGILAFSGGKNIKRKHLPWLELFADQTAGAVHSASLLARAEKARAETHELNEFSKKLNATPELNAHLDHICAYVQENYYVDGIIILRTDLESDKLVHLYESVPSDSREIVRAIQVPLNEQGGIIFRTYRRRKPFYVSPGMMEQDIFRKSYPGMAFDRRLVDDLKLNSFMLVPLIVQEQVIGMVMFTAYGLRSNLSRHDLSAITRFCEQIAGGLQSSALLESIREKRQLADLARAAAEHSTREIEQLNSLSRRINESMDQDVVLDDVFAYFLNTFRIDGCFLYRFDPGENELFLLKYSDPYHIFGKDERVRKLLRHHLVPSLGTLYATFNRRKTFYMKDAQSKVQRHNPTEMDRLIVETWGFNDFLQIPLVIQSQSIGILCLTRLKEPMRLTKEELRSIERACEQITGAIHGASLFKQLEEANQKLQQMDRAKTRFFANMSHEFRTPLTLILAPVESIIKGDYGESLRKTNSIFRSILQNGLGLLKLINNLLDFTKIEAGRMSARKQKTDMLELLKYYKSSVQSAAETRGLEVVLTDKTGELPVYVDRDLMGQAIMNLLSNAFKFTPAPGKILIQLELADSEMFRVTVEDTGVGVPEDKLETIFERFGQADQSPARQYEGTGIGLSLTREIVELHGGQISVESKPGEGAVFSLLIPIGVPQDELSDVGPMESLGEVKPYLLADFREAPDSVSEVERSGSEAERPHEYSILLVEDNPDMRSFLTTLLERNYNVFLAVNGRLGLEKAREIFPDLILSDVMMPEMDGYEMTKKIKNTRETRDIPVILLSAKADVMNRIEGLEFGADDYLSKPFNSEELLTRIRNQIAGKKLERELKKKKAERDREFAQASLVQKNILTSREFIEDIEQLEIDFVYLPMNGQISGDYYNLSPLEQEGGISSIFLADATGHGTQAALSTMQIDLLYRSTLAKEFPNESFEYINKKFVSELHSKNYFTGIIVDIFTNKIRYSSAGHPEQYLIGADSREIRKLRTKGWMIGMQEKQHYVMEEVPVEKGDMILLFSDGVYEVFDEKGNEFGEERLFEMIQEGVRGELFNRPMGQVIEWVMGKLDEFRGDVAFRDDVTLIGVRIK